MNARIRLPIVAWALLAASTAVAQNQYIGFVYPAGGQQGTTFPVRIGGQSLLYTSEVIVSGEGVTVRLVDYHRNLNNQEMALISQQLAQLRKKDVSIGDEMAARMMLFEFPAPIGPAPIGEEAQTLICPVCATANALDAKYCIRCNVSLDKARAALKTAKTEAPKTEKEIAKQRLIERIQIRFAEDERQPAVRSQTELVFAEVTVAPDARPGRREVRVVTKRGVSNPLAFYVGQVPEVARKPMKTCQISVLGKEHLAQRKRPPEEEELRVAVPSTMNGQIAPGEINRYRFEATKGQRLVIAAKARELGPYVADGVPGWFQAVMKLYDANGREVAYNDDFRSDPDPVIYFEVPEDGEYVLAIHEALFRGRESFVYRITVGELPFVTSIFPLGGPAGQPTKIECEGWNLGQLTIAPPKDAAPGLHLIAATDGETFSNHVPFAVGTLPECLEAEPNDNGKAQKVAMPIVVNGRSDRAGDWDVFEVQGKAGETIVAEVHARRLGSPMDSFLKVAGPDGKIIALNDDYFDAASGYNTDHADSYLMVKLPADGAYRIHLADTRRAFGKQYAYRLRISRPIPDFVLRAMPSKISVRAGGSAAVTVHAMRRDGFAGPIKLAFKGLPDGVQSPGAAMGAKQEAVGLGLKAGPTVMELPVNISVVGTAKVGDVEIVREALPSEDKMQAFLWRHLLPADALPLLVFDPGYQPPADRVRPPIRDEDRPKDIKPNLTRSSVERYMRELESLYQDWLLTDDFMNREVANVEARTIK